MKSSLECRMLRAHLHCDANRTPLLAAANDAAGMHLQQDSVSYGARLSRWLAG